MVQGVVGLGLCPSDSFKQARALLFRLTKNIESIAASHCLIQSAAVNSMTGSQTWQSQPHA